MKNRKKHGFCQYPGCNLDLGLVHVATKFCLYHSKQKRKQDAQIYQRERYKSKYQCDRVIGGVYKNPKPIPKGLKENGPCPGNGNGFCGAKIRRERALSQEGFSTPFFDYVCGTHRFPDPQEEIKS